MSLTNNQDAQRMDTVLDFAASLAVIMDNKKLADAVQNAYGLSNAEKARSAEARQNITQYVALINEHTQKKQLLDSWQKSLEEDKAKQEAYVAEQNSILNQQRAENDKIVQDLNNQKASLAAREAEVSAAAESVEKEKRGLAVINQEIDVKNAALQKETEKVANAWAEVRNYEASLKEKAAKLQQLTAAL